MKLKKIEINNYKSIQKVELPIDEQLTTLVGANEHGKTNLLRAIQLLDFKTPITESDKRVSKDGSNHETKISYEFELSETEVGEFNQSTEVDVAPSVRVRALSTIQHNGNEYQPPAEFDVTSDEAKQLVEAGSAELIEANEPVKDNTKEVVQISKKVCLEVAFNDGSTNTYKMGDALPSHTQDKLLQLLKTKLEEKVFYFDTFEDRLKHRIPKDEIVNKSDAITNGLMKLAGLTQKENLIFEDTSGARNALLSGERELTKQLKNLWIQGKEDNIEARLTISNDGSFLNVEIEDINTYGDVSTRSRGFLFFLSFILKYKEFHDGALESFIFLIDEPGIFLHPRGQKDLLLYLEKLSAHNQLIYTTHSPFMINRLNNFRIRVISKSKEKGTQVDIKPFIHNWKSLRASLGMLLSDSFYYAENNLIVEGSSDRLFILSLLKLFSETGLIKADLNILSIIDSGGCPNVPTMVQIVKSEERPFVVLVDSDTHGNNAKSSILKKGVSKEKIKQVSDFLSNAVTIEDLLPRKYLKDAVNAYVSELVEEGVCSQPTQQFNSTVKVGVMSKLQEYLKSNCNVDEISKLNIARHFEEIIEAIPADQFKHEEFEDCKKPVEWIADVLKIKLELN